MVIAAHIFPAQNIHSPLADMLRILADQHSNTTFVFFTNKGGMPPIELPGNARQVIVSPTIKSAVLLRYWLRFRLPALLKRNNVSVFIGEAATCNIALPVTQYLFAGNTAFLFDKKPEYRNPFNSFLRKSFTSFLKKKSSTLFVAETFMQAQLSALNPAGNATFHFTGHGLSALYQPATAEEKSALTQSLTGGIDYFYCECASATRQHITTVLKAFSIFKKRLKSGMKLILYLHKVSLDDCVKDFGLYKYRHDVVIADKDTAFSKAAIIAAAHSALYLPAEETGLQFTGLEILKCGVPLIVPNGNASLSLYRDAALHSLTNEKELSENMMLLYKDERLNKTLAEKGIQLAAGYTIMQAAQRMWEKIGVDD